MTHVTLTLPAADAGYLRGLLEREIVNVDRQARVVGYRCQPEDREMVAAYRRQLQDCLTALRIGTDQVAA